VRTYGPASGQVAGLKVALLNHGYGIANGRYAFLARNLVAHGYFVLSVQQVLPTDAPLPSTGNPTETRRPAWERGVQSLRAVLAALPRAYPGLDRGHILLVGHSFGGDIVMLFAQEYPAEAAQVISLDNCRMPLPRQAQPRVLALRSSDQQPDPGVLPTPAEQAALGMRVVSLPATRHGDMCDNATKAQQQEMNHYINAFLAS
jgi:dienelactone hydrolase